MSATGEPEGDGRHHGSESFFVLGEGLLGESGGGRAVATAAAAPPFRFTRMGPRGRALARDARVRLARAMTAGGGGFSEIPAGYTYLGQFIDHDLTFDKTSVALGTHVSPAQLLQGRSPALDLDSLYGNGPGDPASARFYGPQGLKLLMGKTEAVGSGKLAARQGFDLPRDPAHKLAVIPDKRNDENLAVAQTHLAFIRFHNRVVTELSSVPAATRFAQARRLVTLHYQWMIRHDYLPRICAPAVIDDVFTNGRKLFEVGASPTAVPTMPIEFSVGAFRLGHSMVRGAYNWNVVFDDGAGTLDLLFSFSATSGGLGRGARLPSNWIADFRRLYQFKQAPLKVPAAKFNFARRIDTRLATPLGELPPRSFGGTGEPPHPIDANLAFRNLARARMVRLATGQGMVTFMKSRGVNVKALTNAQLRDGADGGADLSGLTPRQRDALLAHTPLWFYVLREAELNNGKLTGVGGRIVAETFHRAMEGSAVSIVRDPSFKPSFGPNDHTFNMPDLLFFAFEGKASLLNPLGD